MRLLPFTAVCLALTAATPAPVQGKPSRSECMVGYRLDWSNVQEDRADVANSIAAANRPLADRTLAGLIFQERHSELYLIFREGCEEKASKASALFDRWREKGIELPDFTRIPDPILPSQKTLDIRGPSWRDGEPDGIPPSQFNAPPDDQSI